ncbi:MAG: hypothetical protein JKY60_15855 [Kordiimonadaceae bacterium]|nr:hypothetical protein [Kordiimonadaceae bacterium]
MEYKILRVNSILWVSAAGMQRKLTRQVNEHIADGWEPLGAVTHNIWTGMYQAMTRRADD